jgi:ribosomal protein L11 methyltransferase
MDVGRIAERNWNEAWHEFFKPIEIAGELTVVPSWLAGAAETREIVIHPAMAFGTGHHATTRLCLEALVDLHKSGITSGYENFLDLGTGSGILAIAAADIGLSGIGLDIDPVAVQNAGLNAGTNSCGGRFLPAAGGLEALAENAKFDLVMANILSGPLIEMSAELSGKLRPGGAMILSGILAEQSGEVEAAYSSLGLHGPEKKNEGEWTALIYRKPL